MKKRAVIIRFVCYLLMLCAVLAWPAKKIIYYDFPKNPPQKFLFPVRGEEVVKDSRYLKLENWSSQISAAGKEIPANAQSVFVTLGKNPQGTVMPLKIYYSSREIPKGVPFIRAHYRLRSQDKIAFSVSFGKFHLPPHREFNAKEFLVLVKVYPDGTFQVEDLKINGKFLKDF